MPPPDVLIHSVLEHSMKKLRIAAVLPGGVYSYLSAKGRIQLGEGRNITNPIQVGGNPNVTTAEYYDRVPISQTSEAATVKYNYARVVGTYIISTQEIDENTGPEKVFDIATMKMRALEISIKKFQRTRAVGVNSGKDPLGLGNLLPSVNNSGTVGGINLATQINFRHSVYNYNGSLTAANIEDTFDDILLDLNTDRGKVSVIFAGRRIFNMHRKAAKDNAQIQFGPSKFGKKLANLGLTGTTHQGIPIVYDEELHTDDAYFINTNDLMMHILKNANMKLNKLKSPYDQDVIGGRYVMQYQLCTWRNYRSHAYVTNRS